MPGNQYSSTELILFKKLIQNTPFVYCIIDKDWRFVLSEGKGLKVLGWEPGQIVGMSVKDLYSDNKSIMDAFEAVFNGETIISTTEAHGMAFESYYIPYYGDDGQVELLTWVSVDVTEKVKSKRKVIELNKNLEKKVEERTLELSNSNEELIALNEELTSMNEEMMAINEQLKDNNQKILNMQDQLVESEKMAALGNLVAGVAHEVNTPIGVSITAASHLSEAASNILKLKEQGKSDEEEMTYLLEDLVTATSIIDKNLSRAGALVQSFKQLSVDQVTEEKRIFNLGDYIDDLILSLSPSYKKTNIDISFFCHEKLMVNSWPGVIAQIITNLVFNATQHAYDDMDQGVISIEALKEKNQVKLMFKDDGKGIKKAYMKKIFNPFFTTNRNKGGSGLGLSVVYSLVTQRIGGSIECISQEGKGTEFTIIFPIGDLNE